MIEVKGNIWDYHDKGYWICIPINGNVKSNGKAVMGRGIALEAKQRFPRLPYELGQEILKIGNVLHHWGKEGLLFLPTKNNWWEASSLDLIEKSCQELRRFFDEVITDYPIPICLPRLGCGNGRLDWETEVKPLFERYLDNRFIVVGKERDERN